MRTREEAIACCMQLADVYEDYPFRDKNWTVMRHCQNKKAFAWIFERQGNIWVNVKCAEGWLQFWRQKYEAVIPAYHLNKEHWILNFIIVFSLCTEKHSLFLLISILSFIITGR